MCRDTSSKGLSSTESFGLIALLLQHYRCEKVPIRCEHLHSSCENFHQISPLFVAFTRHAYCPHNKDKEKSEMKVVSERSYFAHGRGEPLYIGDYDKSKTTERFTLAFSQIGIADTAIVGGKNATLGELWNELSPGGVSLVDGFATTADAFRRFMHGHGLDEMVLKLLTELDVDDIVELKRRGQIIRQSILTRPLPLDLCDEFVAAYRHLCARLGHEPPMAVSSSIAAEDTEASFAGTGESYLNVRGRDELLSAIHRSYASVFSDRAISYRLRLGFDNSRLAISVSVQPMVRSDLACSGVVFNGDPESGSRDVVDVTASYGLSEFIVKGSVVPDEWLVSKPASDGAEMSIISRRLGTKKKKLIYSMGEDITTTADVTITERQKFSLRDDEVLKLAKWACAIEKHYSDLAGQSQSMDIEWAKDGETGDLFIIRARPPAFRSVDNFELAIKEEPHEYQRHYDKNTGVLCAGKPA